MPQYPSTGIRTFRNDQDRSRTRESSTEPERVPFLTQDQTFNDSSDLENGAFQDPSSVRSDAAKSPADSCTALPTPSSSFDHVTSQTPSRWPSPDRKGFWSLFLSRRYSVGQKQHTIERPLLKTTRSTALKKVLRLLGFSLMLLGFLEFIALASGLLVSFFPDEADDEFDGWKGAKKLSGDLARWPTDFSADIHPVSCHSHNDYWRKEPLFSALRAGCTGVEADVWLYEQELYVGHSTASLTPERTLRNLYINPLVNILDKQNPLTTFHKTLDSPRNGVFDTESARTLVLLIDFKTDGPAIWPYVSEQLEPLREKHYLTHFNGTDVVEGPVTVVVTGNAPFNMVVANSDYRDMFFDAPLDLMDKLDVTTTSTGSDTHAVDKRWFGNQGQGHSGAAPVDPAIYSLANSYYASVDFTRTIGFPWRGRLSHAQKEKMRKQIAGAHARGLKVRYWGVPSWPKGLRNYLWRVQYKEGVDYLNVDDLRAATKGTWNWGKKGSWFSGPWQFADRSVL
ncbi:hypothetical protein PV11_02938 [Exophiala sideris]|uniref:Altered inheritance of mitochondria protein 6 n=1 Tax=Exophiala sideris TaxID=1016849 RepID=A0A0D1ZKR0_9EURO|nr:hypothetical protein PV11_02938 [Exophiala sideris]